MERNPHQLIKDELEPVMSWFLCHVGMSRCFCWLFVPRCWCPFFMDIVVKEVETDSHWRKYASTVAVSADRDRGLTPEMIKGWRFLEATKNFYMLINFFKTGWRGRVFRLYVNFYVFKIFLKKFNFF